MVIERTGRTVAAVCGECACGMLTLEEAVAVAGEDSRELYRRVEAGTLHAAETPERLLLFCLNSLLTQEK